MKMINKFFAMFGDTSGATAVEYGLITALVSLAIIAGASTLGSQTNAVFDTAAGKLGDAVTGTP